MDRGAIGTNVGGDIAEKLIGLGLDGVGRGLGDGVEKFALAGSDDFNATDHDAGDIGRSGNFQRKMGIGPRAGHEKEKAETGAFEIGSLPGVEERIRFIGIEAIGDEGTAERGAEGVTIGG